jgi:hypothetical protein
MSKVVDGIIEKNTTLNNDGNLISCFATQEVGEVAGLKHYHCILIYAEKKMYKFKETMLNQIRDGILKKYHPFNFPTDILKAR